MRIEGGAAEGKRIFLIAVDFVLLPLFHFSLRLFQFPTVYVR